MRSRPGDLRPWSHGRVVAYARATPRNERKARDDYEKGEYRWVAQVVDQVVFADPDNTEAKGLQADTLEQLGYQTENGTWRDFYLSAAKELRDGVVAAATPNTASPDIVTSMTFEMLLDFLGVRLNGPRAADIEYTFNVNLTEPDESYGLEVENGVLNYTKDLNFDSPTATVTATRSAIDAVILGTATFSDQVESGAVTIQGEQKAFTDFLAMLDDFEFWFNIGTP